MWLVTSTPQDISNAVWAVATYCSELKGMHWKTALGILGCIKGNGITFLRGTISCLTVEVLRMNADFVSKATDTTSASGVALMCAGVCMFWF